MLNGLFGCVAHDRSIGSPNLVHNQGLVADGASPDPKIVSASRKITWFLYEAPIERDSRMLEQKIHCNLGQDRLVSINQLADMIAEIAGIRIIKKHVPGPQGVRGRNSDNTRLRQVLGWEPEISLEAGLARLYTWIEAQVHEKLLDRETREGLLSVQSG